MSSKPKKRIVGAHLPKSGGVALAKFISTTKSVDTAGAIMTLKKLAKIRADLVSMQLNAQGCTESDLIEIAKRLRRHRTTTRGKEPTYVREHDPILQPPLSIPAHGKNMKIGTTKNIIFMLLNDVDVWQQHLDQQEDA